MMTVDMVKERLSVAVNHAGSQKAWAEKHGISAAYVNDVLACKRKPGKKILDTLGLCKIDAYLPKKAGGSHDQRTQAGVGGQGKRLR